MYVRNGGFPTILHVNPIKWCGYMYRYYGPRGRSRKYDPPGAVWARRSNPHLVAPRESRPRIGTGNNWTICLFFFPNRILTGRRPRFFSDFIVTPSTCVYNTSYCPHVVKNSWKSTGVVSTIFHQIAFKWTGLDDHCQFKYFFAFKYSFRRE